MRVRRYGLHGVRVGEADNEGRWTYDGSCAFLYAVDTYAGIVVGNLLA